jgi:hypothetical protein
MEICERPKLSDYDVDKCAEFDIWIFTELSIESKLYDRPFDVNPNGEIFSCNFAQDCMIGEIYSKDFAYYYCEDCGRYVCAQNPSNGWHSQGHFGSGEFECNKCYEERTLENGINEDFDGETIPGQFYSSSDIEDNNWIEHGSYQAGSGHSDYVNPQGSIKIIQELIDSGKKVLINYDSMSIGGMGGYFTVYTK